MNTKLLEKMACVKCRKPALQEKVNELICSACGQSVTMRDNIPDCLSHFCIGDVSWKEGDWSPESYESYVSQMSHRLKNIDKPLLQSVSGDVLEIGCGTCRLAPMVKKKGASYFGLDPFFPFLSYAYKHRGLRKLVRGQGERIPFQDKAFDCLISGFYAYRNVNPELGLPEARRVLKKGGTFTFDLLNHWMVKLKQLKMSFKEQNYDILRSHSFRPPPNVFEFINFSQLKQKAEKSGFLVEDVISIPVTPISALNRTSNNFYYRGKKTVYLGYNVIITLKAV